MAVFVGLVMWRMWPQAAGADVQAYAFSGTAMGTSWNVKVVADSLTDSEVADVEAVIKAVIEDVEARMSTWRPESELSRLNKQGANVPFRLSAEILEVLTVAKSVHDSTGGAFDPTVGPLVDAWGFGPGKERVEPGDQKIKELLARVGLDGLSLDSEQRTATKAHEHLQCDLSGIAKGYGVDKVAAVLVESGYPDFMVEIGGEVAVRGINENDLPYRIGIERPVQAGREVFSVIGITGLAVATSGDYRNYREVDGVRLSHTIDPRTGYPVGHNLASVTVVHPSCTYADAMATALTVLGPQAALALAVELKLAVQLIIRVGPGEFDILMTPQFKELMVEQ